MQVDYKILQAGYCFQNRKNAIRGAKSEIIKFPANFALIKHEKHGYILYDTGYSEHFYAQTKQFPYCIYAKVTKVVCKKEHSAVNILKRFNISADEINYIIISHFHADHISGLRDFKNAKFICFENCYKEIKNNIGFKALLKGFIPKLLPDDFEERLMLLNNKDIFNDNTLIAMDLSGHVIGQLGLLINNETLLASDACWQEENYKEMKLPPDWILNFLGNKKQYLKTVKKLHKLNKQGIKIILSHQKYEENNE